MVERAIGFGAGGHARVVIEILQLMSKYKVVGLLDPNVSLHGEKILGISVLGDDSLAETLFHEGARYFFLGLGDRFLRLQIYEKALAVGLCPLTAIHPTALISSSANYGQGLTVMAGALVNAAVEMGDNVLINTGALVEHDCRIGHHVHIAPRACILGGVNIGDQAYIGANCTIRENIQIGSHAVVGAGAVVVKDVPDYTVVAGVPARKLS